MYRFPRRPYMWIKATILIAHVVYGPRLRPRSTLLQFPVTISRPMLPNFGYTSELTQGCQYFPRSLHWVISLKTSMGSIIGRDSIF